MTQRNSDARFFSVCLAVFLAALVWSVINPHDYFTWFLETCPAMAGVIVLALTWRRFPLTRLTYVLILAHTLILIIGGHYTYAEVPLFNWLRDSVSWITRNDYDKIGHFAQGFIPAIIAREVLLRTSPLRPGKWLFVLVAAICLALSACYEFIEWWVALLIGESADAFLGTQGDVWDTQSDMALALLGAILAQLLLARRHDKALAQLPQATVAEAHETLTGRQR